MCTLADKGLEEVGYMLTLSFSNWCGLIVLTWPAGQTTLVIQLDLKDCHAVISIMWVSHGILS